MVLTRAGHLILLLAGLRPVECWGRLGSLGDVTHGGLGESWGSAGNVWRGLQSHLSNLSGGMGAMGPMEKGAI